MSNRLWKAPIILKTSSTAIRGLQLWQFFETIHLSSIKLNENKRSLWYCKRNSTCTNHWPNISVPCKFCNLNCMQINAWHYNIHFFLITFLDSASLKMVNINFSSTHGYCSRKYNEMKNYFLSVTRPFFGKNADVSGIFGWPYSNFFILLVPYRDPWHLGFTVWTIWHGISIYISIYNNETYECPNWANRW